MNIRDRQNTYLDKLINNIYVMMRNNRITSDVANIIIISKYIVYT